MYANIYLHYKNKKMVESTITTSQHYDDPVYAKYKDILVGAVKG